MGVSLGNGLSAVDSGTTYTYAGNNTAVIVGSSTGAKCGLVNGLDPRLPSGLPVTFVASSDDGILNHLNPTWGNVFEFIGNYAVSGTFSADAVLQLQQALQLKPRFVFLFTANNNRSSTSPAYTADQIFNDIKQCFDMCRAAGAFCFVGTLHPFTTETTASATLAIQVNRLIKKEAQFRSDVFVLDLAENALDPLSTLNQAKTNYMFSTDGIHNTGLSFKSLVTKYKNDTKLKAILQDIRPRIFSVFDTKAVTSNSTIVTTNPFMLTPTTVSGTGISGQAPTTCSVSILAGAPTVVSSVTSRSDGLGNDWTGAVTFTSSADLLRLLMGPEHTRIVAGHTYRGSAKVRATGLSNVKAISLILLFILDGGITYTRTCMTAAMPTAVEFGQSDMAEVELMTQKFQIPANNTTFTSCRLGLQIESFGAGGVTATWATATIDDLT